MAGALGFEPRLTVLEVFQQILETVDITPFSQCLVVSLAVSFKSLAVIYASLTMLILAVLIVPAALTPT